MTHRRACRMILFSILMISLIPSSHSEEIPVDQGEVVDMSPESPAPWGLRHLSAPLVSIVRGTDHMYAPRNLRITTIPVGGYLDLFYVRSGFQKRFEQAEAPVTVILPSRLESSSRDTLIVRAFAEGYRQKSVTFKLGGKIDDVEMNLSPLPNSLIGVSHRYFAGRTTVSFLTAEPLTFRLQEANDGYGVILAETAISDEAKAGVAEIFSPLIAESYSQQLGEDLMVKLVLPAAAPGVEVRSRQSHDAPRDLHVFSVDLVPADSARERVESATRALADLRPSDVTGCALVFDGSLREALDSGPLARALRPDGSFTDRYTRAAMRRLGELSPNGSVELVDGSRLRPGNPLELEMAMSNAADARGFLALLRAFSSVLESDEAVRAESLRSLLAPEMVSSRFVQILNSAQGRERACVGSG